MQPLFSTLVPQHGWGEEVTVEVNPGLNLTSPLNCRLGLAVVILQVMRPLMHSSSQVVFSPSPATVQVLLIEMPLGCIQEHAVMLVYFVGTVGPTQASRFEFTSGI